MANRYQTPFPQNFANPVTGAPLAGGKLSFFATGTTTPLATFSDSALTIPNSNPIILDSNGFPQTAIFLQNLAYNVVLADSNNVQVWQADPVYASDFSTFAQVRSVNGNPNGQLAGTQGSLSTPASLAWDFTNNILYVCTLTGSASGTPPPQAVWTAVNPSASAGAIQPPTGRLTLTSGTPVISADVIGAGAVEYTAFNGNTVPIFGGSSFSQQVFSSDLVLTLAAQHAADTLYDIFVFLNSGVLTLVTGPAWNNSTAGSCTRGTGATTTQISRVNGILVNAVQISGRNGASTFTIPANQATYLGTMYVDHTAGQTTCHVTPGQNRKWGVWNAYNRVLISILAREPGVNWSYALTTIRASNGAPAAWSSTVFNVGSGTAANGCTVLCGLAEPLINVDFSEMLNPSTASVQMQIGVGVNSTTVITGMAGQVQCPVSASFLAEARAQAVVPPALGITTISCLESVPSAVSSTFLGTSGLMQLTASYMG